MNRLPSNADEWLRNLHIEFMKETDRGAAIVAAAMLEEVLKLLIRAKLVVAPKTDRSIIDGAKAPLNTFDAKIDAAYQMGLISKFMASDLHVIRNIRNKFAHSPIGHTFESESIRDAVRALNEGSDYNKRNPSIRKNLGPPGGRGDFLAIAAWILYSLHTDIEATVRIEEMKPEFGYFDIETLEKALRSRVSENEAT